MRESPVPNELVGIAEEKALLHFDKQIWQGTVKIWSKLHVVKRELKVNPLSVQR